MYMMYRRHGSTEYDTENYSEHYSEHYSALFRDTELCSYITQFQCRIWSQMRSQLSLGDPESHSYNADTAHLETVWDKLSAEQRSLKRGMTVLDSQRPLPQTITVPELQERSTMKRIHQKRRWVNKPHTQVTIPNEIPTQSWQSRDTRLLWISHWRSPDAQMGMTIPESKINPYRKQSPYRKCWEEAPWSTLTGRESQLEISQWAYLGRHHKQSQQAYVEKSQQAKTTMWIPRQVTAVTGVLSHVSIKYLLTKYSRLS